MTVRAKPFFDPVPASLYKMASTSVLYLVRKSCVFLLVIAGLVVFKLMYGRGNSNTI